MMSTMEAAVRRRVTIDFLFLDPATCGRCRGTGANIDTALALVGDVLEATGAEVELRKVHVQSLDQALALEFASSPTIRVNGRDIALELRESPCAPGGCSCGAGASCRVWPHDGVDHDEAPVGLIVDAVLAELYGDASSTHATPAYVLPDKLMRVFAAKAAGAPGGGCCG
jgi:hypothetical protein